MEEDSKRMSPEGKRTIIISWGIALIMVFLAWAFTTKTIMIAVGILGFALVFHGHFPVVFTLKRLGVVAIATILVIGGWILGRHSITDTKKVDKTPSNVPDRGTNTLTPSLSPQNKTTKAVQAESPKKRPQGQTTIGKIEQTQAPCSGGIIVGGTGGTANGGNCGPPPLVLEVGSVETDVYNSSESFASKEGFHKTEITIIPNQQVIAPFTITLEFDNPVSEIGHTVKNVAVQMSGGVFRVGLHAREAVLTSIGPSHPLVVVVYSLLVVKLVSTPSIEF
jgi:hypothetical protein